MKKSATGKSAVSSNAAAVSLTRFHWPQTVIGRFVARRTMRGAALWALAFGAVVASKSVGYATAYSTAAERTGLAASFGNNIGLNALLGFPNQIDTLAGFAVWNTLGVMVIIGAIWAFLLATRTFRGEEDAGRFELLLSGQTTGRQAAANTLLGLGCSLLVLYLFTAITFIIIGSLHAVNFDVTAALFFALAAVSAAAIFMTFGAVASQLMPTRTRAAGLSAGIFGASFLVRAMADTTSAHWLLNLTPLGWIEKLQPLYGSQPIWLVPIGTMVLLLSVLTIWLAGRRDLGDSIIADKDTAEPHTALLNRPLTLAIRLTRAASISWLFGIGFIAVFFGLLTKSVQQAFTDSLTAQHAISRLAHAAQAFGATTFLGIVFFFVMTLTMVCVASAVSAMREDEATGYLDNLLVRPVSRVRWLTGRLTLIIGVIILAGLISSAGVWLTVFNQHLGLTGLELLRAGSNAMIPGLLLLGIGIGVFGCLPRLTSLITYSAIAWSFLIQMLSSGINLNHWLLDTSILHHVALAPAAAPNWHTNSILLTIGVLCCLIGLASLNRRDLQTE